MHGAQTNMNGKHRAALVAELVLYGLGHQEAAFLEGVVFV